MSEMNEMHQDLNELVEEMERDEVVELLRSLLNQEQLPLVCVATLLREYKVEGY